MIEVYSKDVRIFLLSKGIKFKVKDGKKYAIIEPDKFDNLIKDWKKIKPHI